MSTSPAHALTWTFHPLNPANSLTARRVRKILLTRRILYHLSLLLVIRSERQDHSAFVVLFFSVNFENEETCECFAKYLVY